MFFESGYEVTVGFSYIEFVPVCTGWFIYTFLVIYPQFFHFFFFCLLSCLVYYIGFECYFLWFCTFFWPVLLVLLFCFLRMWELFTSLVSPAPFLCFFKDCVFFVCFVSMSRYSIYYFSVILLAKKELKCVCERSIDGEIVVTIKKVGSH